MHFFHFPVFWVSPILLTNLFIENIKIHVFLDSTVNHFSILHYYTAASPHVHLIFFFLLYVLAASSSLGSVSSSHPLNSE